jgi:hypothetical protein
MQAQRALSAADIVAAWEYGRDKHPVDRALLLLSLVCPSMLPSTLSNLTVGQRNMLLIDSRQKTLGALASCFVKCPQCEASLEFTLDIAMLYEPEKDVEPATHTVIVDNFSVLFRLPTSLDLAAIVGNTDVAESRHVLIERCVLQAERDGQAITAAHLPETVIIALAKAMLEHDPHAEIEITLSCSECGHSWATVFDIVSFFWTELEAQAKRLLRDVDTLACAYGWRETDILALSTVRRQFYLELVHR